jgi:hypothetical protein
MSGKVAAGSLFYVEVVSAAVAEMRQIPLATSKNGRRLTVK